MRRLMQRASIVDAETEMSLRIIDRFDRLVAERVDVGALSAHAAEITGRAVGVDEWLTGTQLRCCSAGTPLDDATAVAREVHGAAIAARLRGRRALALELHDGRAVLAASVEQAAGRSGVVWAHHEDGRDWSIADQIAVERLALAVSARALEEHERASARQQQRVALEVLVSETHTVEEARQWHRGVFAEVTAARIRVPALHLGGWWDVFLRGQLRDWAVAGASTCAPQRLIMDATDHQWERIVRSGEHMTARHYLDAQHERPQLARRWAEFFERYDLLLAHLPRQPEQSAIPHGADRVLARRAAARHADHRQALRGRARAARRSGVGAPATVARCMARHPGTDRWVAGASPRSPARAVNRTG